MLKLHFCAKCEVAGITKANVHDIEEFGATLGNEVW